MKILLVRPKPSNETIGLQHVMIVEPLELEILSACRRNSDETILADMIVEKHPFSYFIQTHKPDVVCITGYITNVNTIIEYCSYIKETSPKTATIVGGVHCEVCPEDFNHPAIDFRVVRNAAVTFADLLNHIETNTPIPAGTLTYNQDFNESELPPFDYYIPIADRKITEKHRKYYFYIFHKNVALIKTSFGCPYSCTFCFCKEITRGGYKQRPLEEVITELESIKEKEIYIVDDDFLFDKKRLTQFIQLVKDRNIKKNYLVYGRADFIAQNPELISQLKQIGLKTVIVGFESFSEKELDKYNKNSEVTSNRDAMNVLNANKIDCFATMIVSPEWTKDDFKQMVVDAKNLGIHFVNLQPLTPLPKTGISYPEDELLIKKHEYEKWDLAHISVKPLHMTTVEFYKQILKSYNKILFQRRVIWKYMKGNSIAMLYRMVIGTYRVNKQYQQKIKEAANHA